MKRPPFTVALAVIARDEASRIERLLTSVRPWVDRMLVLDTGSTDATAQLAAACGAQVEHFRWCNDFSAARNRALELAAADWHLVMDADEWLVDGGPSLLGLRSLAPDFVGALRLCDHFDGAAGEAHEVNGWVSRVLPAHVRYEGVVHEQPQHTLPLVRLPLVAGHDGHRAARLAGKRGRNRQLLAHALQSTPRDAYLWYQWGKDCAVYDEHEPAEEGFAKAAALLQGAAPWWNDLVARRLFSLKKLKRHADAMDFASAQMPHCGGSPDFFFAIGDVLLDLAADTPARANELLPMIEQAWAQCLALGERPDQPGSVAGRGSWLAAHNLALVLEGTGRSDEAARLRAAHPAPQRSLTRS